MEKVARRHSLLRTHRGTDSGSRGCGEPCQTSPRRTGGSRAAVSGYCSAMRGGKELESSKGATVVDPGVPTVLVSRPSTAGEMANGADAASKVRRGDCVG